MQGQSIYTPPLTKLNKILIIISVGLFILSSVLPAFTPHLGLSAHGFFSGHLYQLITYPFVSRGLLEIVFNCLLLWFIGSELESQWGLKRYSSFLASAALGAGLVYLFVSFVFFQGKAVYTFPLMGLHGVCSALLLAYAILYPNRIFSFMLVFPVKAKWFCGILIFMELYSGFFSPAGAQAWGHLAAMFTGYSFMLVVSSHWWRERKAHSRAAAERQKRVQKSHLSVVKNDPLDDENGPRRDDQDERPKYWH